MELSPFGDCEAFEELLGQLSGERRLVTTIAERSAGAQGASGARVRYFDVVSTDRLGANAQHAVLVSKDATLLERRVLQLLTSQGCAVPPVYMADVTSAARIPIYMPYLEARPVADLGHPVSSLTLAIADGLAAIHARNRLQPPAWLQHASDDYRSRLWLYAWQEQWEQNLADPLFAAEFGPYTARLVSAWERLHTALEALTAEGTSLTLVNTDLIPEDIRLWRGTPRFIDWEQAAYGTFYLDLPNYFLVETALAYRDALAAHGHTIPVPEFLERYHEVGRYMGLRYLGAALELWGMGSAQRAQGRWFLYYTFKLALHGR